MSKIKVDTIQSNNENVELAPNGSGLVEVKGAGGGDGTVKLVSQNGTNSVKIKSPPHSAQQSQTIILPDNNITQDAFLKVKSVSGTSPDKVGQLEYASIAEPDLTNLNASNLTSGTVPAARFATALPATTTALKLIQKSHVTTGTTGAETSVASIAMSVDVGIYYVLFKMVNYNSNYGRMVVETLDASGSALNSSYLVIYNSSGTGSPSSSDGFSSAPEFPNKSGSHTNMNNFGDMWVFNNSDGYGMMYHGSQVGLSNARCEGYLQNFSANQRAYQIRFSKTSGNIGAQTEILLYKLLDS